MRMTSLTHPQSPWEVVSVPEEDLFKGFSEHLLRASPLPADLWHCRCLLPDRNLMTMVNRFLHTAGDAQHTRACHTSLFSHASTSSTPSRLRPV